MRLHFFAQKASYKCLVAGVLLMAGSLLPGKLLAQKSDSYKNYELLTSSLKSLVHSNATIAQLKSIGKTTQGRELWLVTLGNITGTALDTRPGILITGNIEGDHLIGSELSFGVLTKLLEGYGKDTQISALLEHYVIYFLPRINPDGAELSFQLLQTGIKTNLSPYDGDNDGRLDEDGPDDLNKDGFITMMRVKDPSGEYCLDPENDQLLKKADPTKGEAGIYKVFWEGLDNDGDGFINEDPIGGVDINRNFAHEYPYYQPDAGLHMVSEAETRAVMDWVIAQRNIAIMLHFSESDNLLTPPNSKGQLSSDRGLDLVKFADASNSGAGKVGMIRSRSSFGRFGGGGFMMGGGSRGGATETTGRASRPAQKAATTYNPEDLTFYAQASEKYKELTGIKTAPVVREPKGAFSEYGYFQYGVLSFCTPGWGFPESQDTARRSGPGMRRGGGGAPSAGAGPAPGMGGGRSSAKGIDSDYYKYLKENNIDGFVHWTPFNHPELGAVEIGGFTPQEIANPVSSEIPQLVEGHTNFVLYLGSLFAKMEIIKTEVLDHGDGLFRIKAEVSNTGYLPTALQHGVVSRSVKPTLVQLELDPDRIISGNSKTNFFQQLAGSGNIQKFEWLIKGKKGEEIQLRVAAQKAGTVTRMIQLK